MTSGRVVLLLSSPRVAPGLLSRSAWAALESADEIWCGDPAHPQLPALAAAGLDVRLVEQPDPAAALVEKASAGAVVVWLAGADGEPRLGAALGGLLATRSEAGGTELPELEVLLGSYDLPGARLIDLVSVMDRLRNDCAWVGEQTHRSLVRYLIEEAYETVEAIETGDRAHLREELGDLLFQAVFHARLAEETEAGWTIDDVAADLTEKLIRRNPHVFGDREAGDVQDIENVWDQLKSEEKRRSSAVEGVPFGLPALALADKLLERTNKADLTVPLPDSDVDEIGPALFALAVRARAAGVDPEQALRDTIRRYVEAIRSAEQSG